MSLVIIRITENEEDICLKDIPAKAKLGAEISSLRREESRTKQMIHGAVFPQEVWLQRRGITNVLKALQGVRKLQCIDLCTELDIERHEDRPASIISKEFDFLKSYTHFNITNSIFFQLCTAFLSNNQWFLHFIFSMAMSSGRKIKHIFFFYILYTRPSSGMSQENENRGGHRTLTN